MRVSQFFSASGLRKCERTQQWSTELLDERHIKQWMQRNPRIGGTLMVLGGMALVYFFSIRPFLQLHERVVSGTRLFMGAGIFGLFFVLFGLGQIITGQAATDEPFNWKKSLAVMLFTFALVLGFYAVAKRMGFELTDGP